MIHVGTDNQLADHLTKPLHGPKFSAGREILRICDRSAPLSEHSCSEAAASSSKHEQKNSV